LEAVFIENFGLKVNKYAKSKVAMKQAKPAKRNAGT